MNLIEIPTGDIELNPRLSANAYQSRIIIDNFVKVKEDYLDIYIEGDFHGSGDGGFRLRHAYLAYKGWLFGQTWTGSLEAPFNDLSRLNQVDTTFRGVDPRFPDLIAYVRRDY